jgi:hypothetical protein
MKFYLTSLGNDDFILGYLFLSVFNLAVNRRFTKLLRGNIQFETVPFWQAEKYVEACQQIA